MSSYSAINYSITIQIEKKSYIILRYDMKDKIIFQFFLLQIIFVLALGAN